MHPLPYLFAKFFTQFKGQFVVKAHVEHLFLQLVNYCKQSTK